MKNEGLKYLDDLRDRLLEIALNLLNCAQNNTPIPDELKQKFRNLYDDIMKIPSVNGTDAYPKYALFINAVYRYLLTGMLAQDNKLLTEFEPILTDVWNEFKGPKKGQLYVFANFFGISTLLMFYATILHRNVPLSTPQKNLLLKMVEQFFVNIHKLISPKKQIPINIPREIPNA
ncbi:MAG: hypothetical protein ACUVTP_01095 [Candidatus Fervidibacter sp.]|uniref:hypothetical protein n=1 Tax=Candidatus Fervidibacter sp. TaxID=3100871 RepID=UPI004049A0BA